MGEKKGGEEVNVKLGEVGVSSPRQVQLLAQDLAKSNIPFVNTPFACRREGTLRKFVSFLLTLIRRILPFFFYIASSFQAASLSQFLILSFIYTDSIIDQAISDRNAWTLRWHHFI